MLLSLFVVGSGALCIIRSCSARDAATYFTTTQAGYSPICFAHHLQMLLLSIGQRGVFFLLTLMMFVCLSLSYPTYLSVVATVAWDVQSAEQEREKE